jgi:NAD(P)-dependent dehydrogenase (short-subunit alcohol dehydrogenase family)
VNKAWFITGASRGFGREWTVAALERGDAVAAAARDIATLAELCAEFGDKVFPVQLDLDDRASCFHAVDQAHQHFGRIDVVVNNAGYGHFGMVEEITEADARRQMETNFFGTFWVTQAALPHLREQGGGHIIQVSSIGGVTAYPGVGLYHASKWALEGFSQALAQEVADFGIRVTLIEPGPYATDWGGASARRSSPLPVYDPVREKVAAARAKRWKAPGDPVATREAILSIVDAERPPLRVFFGEGSLESVTTDYESRLATWREWLPLSVAAQRPTQESSGLV